MIIKTDRSRIESATCPAKRWWEYEHPTGGDVHGLRPQKPNVALSVGTGVHAGVEHLLRNLQQFGYGNSSDAWLEGAIQSGIAAYQAAVGAIIPQQVFNPLSSLDEMELRLFPTPAAELDEAATPYEIAEGMAHVEALIRAFYLSRRGLSWIAENYEVVDVETEHEWSLRVVAEKRGLLDEASILGDINADVVMMSRLDGVLRSKSDGMLYVFELKTAKTLDTRTLRQLQYDDQGLAQSLAAEDKYNEPIAGEQRLYLLKDEKRSDTDNRYRFASPLIRPYVQYGMTPSDAQIEPLYDKPGGGRLGKGFRRQNIWEVGQLGIARWLERLNSRWPEVIDQRVVPLDIVVRTEEDVDSWILTTLEREVEVAFKADTLRFGLLSGEHNLSEITRAFHRQFGKRRKLCAYPSPCPFIGLCHEGKGLALLAGEVQPEEVGFVRRIANHPGEVEINVENN
jgi:hypothetical protein